ncbi:MAG: TonB-dependent receptor, partial [Pseudomonadota bacterium]
FLRGTQSGHTLVLIDGIRVGSATAGLTAFQDLPLALIDRIEVVRGPRASLYGSEAIGGVIQIFTRQGQGPIKPALSFGAGSHNTWEGSTALGGAVGENGWLQAGLASMDTGGFNACRGSLTAGCFTIEPDRDGYRNRSGNWRAGWRLSSHTEAEINGLRTESKNQFDGSYQNEAHSVQQVLGTSLRFSPHADWQSTLQAGQSRDQSNNYKDGLFTDRFDTRHDSLSWQNDLLLGHSRQLIAGIDWQHDQIDSLTAYTATSRENLGVFGQTLLEWRGQDIQVSLRHDDNQQFGGHVTGNAAWGYTLTQGLRWTLAYGTAFKAPTFNDLYYPGYSNPNLRPEESRSAEMGLAGSLGEVGRWSLNLFETQLTDLIGLDVAYTPANIHSARIRGLEGIATTRVMAWELRGNLTWLDPENRSAGPDQGHVLPRRAEQALTLHADRPLGSWRLGASLRAEGRRYDDPANRVTLPGYATLDLRTEYHLSHDWRLQARVENLFDQDYETAYRYTQPGRSLYLTLRYQP